MDSSITRVLQVLYESMKTLRGRCCTLLGRKPGRISKDWRGKLVWVLYLKSGGAIEGIQHIILMMRMEEKLNVEEDESY